MKTFNGIPISEYVVLVHSIIFSVLLLGVLAAFGFWLYTMKRMKNPKERQRLRNLKEKSRDDETAKKQLEKIERRNKRRRRRDREGVIVNVLIWCLSICFSVTVLSLGIVPSLTDYIRKDYVVYTGDIEVCIQGKRSYIELEDGTVVKGRGDFDSDDTYGTIVYSKRSKLFLGGIDQ